MSMKRLVVLAVACVLSAPAWAIDFLLDTKTPDALMAYAATLGPPFYSSGDATQTPPIPPQINVAGPLPGGGSYFVNIVGQIQVPTNPPTTTTDAMGNTVPVTVACSCYYVRVRMNGPNLYALGMLPLPPSSFTVYPPFKTLPDGITQDPTYTQPAIGVIE